MNPLTKVRLINELNEREANLNIKESVSWHTQYKDSAWVFIGGFPYELTEGDIICVFSQYGEIANINLVRDKKTGKSKGFCFLCYEDQRSTILAVDNFNGIKIKGRTIRVDHVENYRPPKDSEDIDDVTKRLREEGCAPTLPSLAESDSDEEHLIPVKKPKKDKKEKKKKKKLKKEKKKASKDERRDTQADSPSPPTVRVKKEKEDTGYEKYAMKGAAETRGERVGQETRNQWDRNKEPDRSKDMQGNHKREEREREREDERRLEKSRDEGRVKDDLHLRQNRDREKERGREADLKRDRHRESEREREKEKERGRENDRDREWERNWGRDRARESERERDKDKPRERDGGSERERDQDQNRNHKERDKWRDREREADRGHTKHSHDREHRRN